jgi:hypothetical protein
MNNNPMKKLLVITLLSVFILKNHCFSQQLSLHWSDKMKYDNGLDGFFDHIIGSNEDRIFIMYDKYSGSKNQKNPKIKVLAFDKSNMRNVASVSLVGEKKNEKRKSQLEGMKFNSVFEKNGNVYVLWEKEVKEKVEIYGEIYDGDLELIESIKKIYSIEKAKNDKKATSKVGIIVLTNKKVEKSIIIGSEIHKGKNENIVFNYAVIGTDLNEVSTSENELRVVQNKKNSSFSTVYTYGDDGMIYLRSTVGYDLESEKSKGKKGRREYYPVLSMINPQTEEFVSEELKFEGYTINGYHLTTSKNNTSLCGFFSDNNKEGRGLHLDGIFHATINPKTFELSEPHFSYFSAELITDLFKGDEEDKKKSTALSRKKRARETEQNKDVLDGKFVIEEARTTEDNGLVIFCSKMYNYSVRTCSQGNYGPQSCTTEYYCQKSNVMAFRLDNQGEIVWAKNVDRTFTYNGTDIYDLKIAEKDGKSYVIYTNSRSDETTKGGKKKRKTGTELRNSFEYVSFNLEDGETEKSIVEVNKKGTTSKERKSVSPLGITVIDNEFFVNSSTIGVKPLGCIASIICFPLYFILFDSPFLVKGEGYLGKISIEE